MEIAGLDGLAQTCGQAVYALVCCDPMWIGDDGQPLDYLPEREALIGDFVQRAGEAVATAVLAWVGERAEDEGVRGLVAGDVVAYEAGQHSLADTSIDGYVSAILAAFLGALAGQEGRSEGDSARSTGAMSDEERSGGESGRGEAAGRREARRAREGQG